MPHPLNGVLEVRIHRHHKFRVGIPDTRQWRELPLYRFFTFQFEGNLHIEFLRGLLRNEVDFLGAPIFPMCTISSGIMFNKNTADNIHMI